MASANFTVTMSTRALRRQIALVLWARRVSYVLAVALGLAAGCLLCGCSGPLTLDRTDGGGDRLVVPALTYPRQLAPCPPATPPAD